MKMLKVAAMLLACAEGTELFTNTQSHAHSHAYHRAHAHADVLQSFKKEQYDMKLSQSFATAFAMEPPKLMTTGSLPEATAKGECPAPGKKLTKAATGGAFLDGCYMNTTRKQVRMEELGYEAQHYLYLWKHSCAFTKWVPSNQFMYSNLDYNPDLMTLERFGFIGMDKKCFWGSIGVLWKRALPANQILPNVTSISNVPKLVQMGQLVNSKSKDGICLTANGTELILGDCAKDNSNDWQYYDSGEIKYRPTNKCVSVAASDNWTPLLLNDCDGSGNQQWDLKPTTNSLFLIRSKKFDKCLNVKGEAEAVKGEKANLFTCFAQDDNMEYHWKEEE